MHETKYETGRLAAAEIARAARSSVQLAYGDRVRIDVERVRRLAIVVQLDITRIEHGPRRQIVAIAYFVLVDAGIGSLDQVADILAIDRAALAVARLAIEQIDLAATHGDGAGNAPEIALEIAGRRVVLGLLVHAGDAKAPSLHDGAEVIRAGDRPVGIVRVECVPRAGSGCTRRRENIRGVLTHFLV